VAAAAFWWTTFSRLARPRPSLLIAAAAASAVVYLLFGTLNFGLWQEWWLALGGLVVLIVQLNAPPRAAA
jgi:hypothetical protein